MSTVPIATGKQPAHGNGERNPGAKPLPRGLKSALADAAANLNS
jgi:hypothetical protein